MSTYKAEGITNTWIVKNRNGSKGTGISLGCEIHELTKRP